MTPTPVVTGTDRAPRTLPVRMPRFLVVLCVVISALGVLMMVMSGPSLLDGDFTSTGSGRRGWVTPPIAFIIGLGLALSPIAIVRQERTTERLHTVEEWHSALVLDQVGLSIQTGPSSGAWPWGALPDDVLSAVPPTGRPVVQYYLERPTQRAELGTEAGVERAVSLVRGRESGGLFR